jgi:hypothetical protein
MSEPKSETAELSKNTKSNGRLYGWGWGDVCAINYFVQNSLVTIDVMKGKKKGKVVPVINLIKHYAMKAYGGVDV